MEHINRCYYCDGTGYVPWVEDPNDRNSVYHIKNMACKCSKGKIMARPHKMYPGDRNPLRVREYFIGTNDLQFMDSNKEVSYPQLVQIKKNEMNVKLNKQRENVNISEDN